jgi:regulator of sigma E protease
MVDTLRSALAYIVDLGVLVFFHELGHYLAARSQGVVVEAFSIGFGPSLVSWRAKSGTVWKLSALPLGGYVKMQGWGEADDGLPPAPGSFSAASLGSRALIVAAGPIANLVLAFVIFSGLFMTVGQEIVPPVFTQVIAGSPAAAAGFRAGDRVITVNGDAIQDFTGLQDIVLAHPGAPLSITVLRHGQVINHVVTLASQTQDGARSGHLGVVGTAAGTQRLSPPAAIAAAGQETWGGITTTLGGLYRLIVHQQGLKDLAGPLGIAQITGKVAAMGVVSVINLIALLSINLGLINLVPIPILDGGHLLFYAAEAIAGRKIPAQAQEMGLRIGVAVIVSLIFVTTFNDLSRLGAVSWVSHLLG